MLVLSRRENDRIVFPGLDVSIEVVRLTRSRATLAIDAPKHIRVIRHELRPGSSPSSGSGGLHGAIRREVMSNIQDEINAATEKLNLARQDLSAGRNEDALRALGEALAELDALRYGASGLASADSETQPADHPTVAGGVAESAAGYTNSAIDDVTDRYGTVVLVDATDGAFATELAELDFAITQAPNDLTVVFFSPSCSPD